MRPEKLQTWKQTGNRLHFRMSNAELEVTIISDFVFRFRYTAEEHFDEDFSYAVEKLNDCLANTFHITEKIDAVIILTEELLIDKAQLLNLTAPELTVLVGGLRGATLTGKGNSNVGEGVVLCIDDLQHEDAFFGCRTGHQEEEQQQYGCPTTIALFHPEH